MSKKDLILKEIFDYITFLKPAGPLDKFTKFFVKSYNHFNIVLLLGSVSNEAEGYHYEEICDLYPRKF